MSYGILGAEILGSPDGVETKWWVRRVLYTRFTDADTSQVLNLHTLFTFPANVWLANSGHYLNLRQVFAAPSLTDADLILGVSGDTNGLAEAVAVETGQSLGIKSPGGTFDEAVGLFNAQHEPLLQMDTVGANLSAFTTGIVDVHIRYFKPRGR
jgi:hypothetical protein